MLLRTVGALTDRSVMPSTSFPLRRSTSKLYCRRKSAPKIDLPMSAITKVHLNARRNPKLSTMDCSPYVRIAVPFAAYSLYSVGIDRRLLLAASTDISAPVSTRKRSPLCRSMTLKRLFVFSTPTPAIVDVFFSFPSAFSHRELHIS